MTTDWLKLWQELAEALAKPGPHGDEGMVRRYRVFEPDKTARPDELLDHVVAQVCAGETVLDIGAGTGRWTIPLSRKARRVTALEPTAGMAEMLFANIDRAGAGNVDVLTTGWEEAQVDPHDIVVAAHSMYTSPDFAGFVRFMEGHARRICFMEARLPPAQGVIGQLSLRIHGTTHDSPNAVIAYNALYALGIDVNVLVEEDAKQRVDATFEDAMERARSQLRLRDTTEHDDLIRRTLQERLTQVEGGWRWPDGKRSALLWWRPRHAGPTMGQDP